MYTLYIQYMTSISNAIYANYHKNRPKAQTQTIKMWKNLIRYNAAVSTVQQHSFNHQKNIKVLLKNSNKGTSKNYVAKREGGTICQNTTFTI